MYATDVMTESGLIWCLNFKGGRKNIHDEDQSARKNGVRDELSVVAMFAIHFHGFLGERVCPH